MKNSNEDTIPNSWVITKIDDIYQVVGGGTPSTKNAEYWNGNIPWITSADISDDGKIDPRKKVTKKGVLKSATNIVPKGSLVVVTRVGLGKVAIAENQLCFSQDIQALLLDDGFIDIKYAYYFLKQAVQIFKYSSRGTTISGVTKKQLRDLHFLIPPFPEQKRISEKIEELLTKLDAGIDSLKQVQILLKRYRQSVLKSAVEGKLTSEWRKQHKDELEPADKLLERILKERKEKWEAEQLANFKAKGKEPPKNWQNKYKEPTLPYTSELPDLPKGWVWVTYSQLGEWHGGGTPSKRKPDFWNNGTIPWVSPKDMKIEYIENTKDYITPKAVKKSTAKLIPAKSLLFVVRSGILRHTLPIAINKVECTINQDLKALSPSKYIDPKYLLQLSSAYNKDLLNSCSKDGTTVQSIETSLLYNYPIPLPPLKEQEKIASETEKLLSLIEKTEKILDSELKRSQSLRQSILKHAFEGKLVPQDPNDEPASVLLEKIKAEKFNSKKSK